MMPPGSRYPRLPRQAPLLAAALCLFSCGSVPAVDPAPSQQSVAPPSSAGAPRLNSWRILGPGGGGAQFNPLLSPHDKKTILVSTDMTGCFLSEDAGASWRMFYLRWTCRFAYDASNPEVFYATANTNGLYRSADRGRSWTMVFPEPRNAKQIYYYEDEAEHFLWGDFEGKTGAMPAAQAVASHPTRSGTVYVAAGAIYRSRNFGKSWERLDSALPDGRKLFLDPRPGAREDRVFLQTGTRFGYLDGRFAELTPPFQVTRIYDSAVVYPPGADPPVIYLSIAGTINGTRRVGALVVSRDYGKSWQEMWQPLASLGLAGSPIPLVRAIATSQANTNVIYVSYGGLQRVPGKTPSFGVARSDDSGKSWRLVWEESDKPADNIDDPWMSSVYGPDWGENPLTMAAHPKDADFLVTTDLGRTLKTTDGGMTWQGVYSRKLPSGGWTSTGLDVLNCYGIHHDPHNSGRILASCTDIGVNRSEDRGATWVNSWRGIEFKWRNTMYWAEYDPEVPGRVWGAASRYHDLPRARTFRNFRPENFLGGMVVSNDSGQTWSESAVGLPDVPFTHFVVDWKSPKDRRTLWAAAMFRGVYRSDDGGKTWTQKVRGISSQEPNAWRLHLDSRGHLYLVIIRRSMTSNSEPALGSLYRSEDRGESWIPVRMPDGVNGPTDLISDPQDPNRLYLTAWPKLDNDAPPAKVSGGGLYLSTDRGSSWRPLLHYPQHMYSVTVDPRVPGRMYCTGFSAGVYRSDDRGETWSRVRGFNFRLGHRIFPDPLDPAMLYVTTMGGAIWHGPAAGTPAGEPDDISDPPPVRIDAPFPKDPPGK